MPRYLILRLDGPMQAWGAHTFEDFRPSNLFPTRSGLLGLLGACLGIDRSDHVGLEQLAQSVEFTVRADRSVRRPDVEQLISKAAVKLPDYHTVLDARKVDGSSNKNAVESRREYLYIEYGHLDVLDGAFVVVDRLGVRTHIPVGGVVCLMLEPGTRVSHAACALAARVGTLLVWIGEAGVRLYSAGQPGGARADRLLYQAKLALDDELRLKVVRKMYALRFGEEPPQRRSVEQLRGIEGARVREMYKRVAAQVGVQWKARNYDVEDWDEGDIANRCLSAATACLYGVTEAAVLAAGYAPAIGFIHTGKPLSFVYDVADIYKFETVVPLAFRIAAKNPVKAEQQVRLACRDSFRETKLLERIIPGIEEMLAAGEIPRPAPFEEQVSPAIPNQENLGDAGHRA